MIAMTRLRTRDQSNLKSRDLVMATSSATSHPASAISPCTKPRCPSRSRRPGHIQIIICPALGHVICRSRPPRILAGRVLVTVIPPSQQARHIRPRVAPIAHSHVHARHINPAVLQALSPARTPHKPCRAAGTLTCCTPHKPCCAAGSGTVRCCRQASWATVKIGHTRQASLATNCPAANQGRGLRASAARCASLET